MPESYVRACVYKEREERDNDDDVARGRMARLGRV